MFSPSRIHPVLGEQIAAHAAAEHPREACGLVLRVGRKLVYRRCRNISAAGGDQFHLDPADWVAAEDAGKILAVVHSHPDASAAPSGRDLVGCRDSGLPWYIVAWPGGAHTCIEPAELPLLGRQFEHGAVDCYTLIRDYYQQVLAIKLPDFERADGWWERGEDLYCRHFSEAGFVAMPAGTELQMHDVIVMQVMANQANHAAVYVGEQKILHHLYGRLSGHDVWGGYWMRHALLLLRHSSCMGTAA